MTRTSVRIYAKAKVGMWSDPDFLDLDPEQKTLYQLLFEHDGVNNAGITPWRPDELAPMVSPTATGEDVRRIAQALQDRKYVMVDEDTAEILVRSYIRHDDVIRQPNMCKPMAAAFNATKSRMLRQMMANELHRLCAESRGLAKPPAGPQTAEVIGILRKYPATVAPERLAAWAAHHPGRARVTTPADDFEPEYTVPVWTPADDFTPADQGEGLEGRVGGKGSPTGSPEPSPTASPEPGEGLGGRDGVTTTTTKNQEIKTLAEPPAAPRRANASGDELELGLMRSIPGGASPEPPTPKARKSTKNDSYDEPFERFWEAYGRKGGKRPAAVAWHRALDRTDAQTIMAAVGPYVASTEGEQKRWRKDAEGWLNADGWESEPVFHTDTPGGPTGGRPGSRPFENPTDPAVYQGTLGGRRRREAEEHRRELEQQQGPGRPAPRSQFA